MLMGKSPAFPMYAADFDVDTNTWTNEEVGLYLRLLLSQWVNGPLPSDPIKLARIGRISRKKLANLFQNISHKFVSNGDGKLQNERLEKERAKQRKYKESQSEAGKRGAEVKWGTEGKPKTRSERLRLAREKGVHTKEEFQEMVNYFDGLCVKCGGGDDGVFRDHIIPIYQGGSDGINNLQPLCRKCNTSKGSENIDHRITYCKNNDTELPQKWIKMPGETHSETPGETIALQSSSSSSPSKRESFIKDSVPVPKKCPHQKIIDLYHEVLPSLPKVVIWNTDQMKILRTRWKEDDNRQNTAWWNQYFEFIAESDFLMGRKNDFTADLEWIVRPSNMAKILNGRYHRTKNGEQKHRGILEWLQKSEDNDES